MSDDTTGLDPDVSDEAWRQKIALSEANLSVTRKLAPAQPSKSNRKQHDGNPPLSAGWQKIADWIDARTALQMIAHSADDQTHATVLAYLLRSLSDPTSSVGARLPGYGLLLFSGGGPGYAVDEARGIIMTAAGQTVGRISDMEVTNYPLRKWLGEKFIKPTAASSQSANPTSAPARGRDRSISGKQAPDQNVVFEWLVQHYRMAADQKRPQPKRELEAFPACRASTGATFAQMKAAMTDGNFPADLKRRRGAPTRKSDR